MQEQTGFEKQMSNAILQLRLRSPFFVSLALFARVRQTDKVPTAATNGREIFVNGEYWEELTGPQRLGLLAHEVLHVALLHVPRRGGREPIVWNIAVDIVVNGMIVEQGMELPQGGVQVSRLAHLSVEEIYHLLQVKYKKRLPMLGLVDLMVGRGMSQDTYAKLEQHWQNALQHARTMTSMLGQGKVPAGMERELAHLTPAKLDWRSYLWRFLVQTPTDFLGYDRRFIGQRLYLETLVGESVRVYVGIDTSGSIGQEVLGVFLSEVGGILSAYPHLVCSLYYVDAECYGPYELDKRGALPAPKGGGGTDFRPFFEVVEREQQGNGGQQVGVCVYLTDGYGTFPEEVFELPVLWVLSPGSIDVGEVPFGEAIRLIPEDINRG